jgi:hypothetical protein
MGRPTKLTPELQEELLKALKGGAYVEDACGYVGIHKDTFYEWMRRGADGDDLYSEFSDAVEKARASAVVRNIALLQKAAEDSWQAAAWWLERTRPNQYGRRTNIAGPDGGAIEIKTDDAEREERLRAIVQRALDEARSD